MRQHVPAHTMKPASPAPRRSPAKPDTRDAARRAREIVEAVRGGEQTDVFDVMWQLDELPRDEVRAALTAWTGPLPDPDRLDAATSRAHGLPPRPLQLRTLSVVRDADVLDLGPLAEEQLRLAGKSWDGADLPPEDRLDGELEDSFAGTLERRVLGDADAAGGGPLFDVLLFAEDAGVVFAAGTTKVLALIAYGKVETRDRRLRSAIEAALASVVDEPVAKKAVVKRVIAKKAVAKRTAAKKTAAKKAAKKKAAKKKSS
jgi:hypothetical protein